MNGGGESTESPLESSTGFSENQGPQGTPCLSGRMRVKELVNGIRSKRGAGTLLKYHHAARWVPAARACGHFAIAIVQRSPKRWTTNQGQATAMGALCWWLSRVAVNGVTHLKNAW